MQTPWRKTPFLSDDLLRQLMGVGEVDLLVGIPSHSNADTIAQYARDRRIASAEFCAPAASDHDRGWWTRWRTDSTCRVTGERKHVLHSEGLTSLRTVHRVTAGLTAALPGSGSADNRGAADLLRARACAVVSPATTNADAGLDCKFVASRITRQF